MAAGALLIYPMLSVLWWAMGNGLWFLAAVAVASAILALAIIGTALIIKAVEQTQELRVVNATAMVNRERLVSGGIGSKDAA
jgi:hypothetical protein